MTDLAGALSATGPFKFQEWRSADRVILVRNPDYQWGPSYAHAGPPYVERLILRIVPELAAQVAAFERGEITVTFPAVIPPTDVRRLQDMKKYTFFTFLRKGIANMMEFNVTKEPFTDVRVRRALAFAIEKKSILHIALEDLGEVAHGPLPPSIWGYWDGIKDYAPGYDPGQAKRLLAEAGWQPGAGGVLQKDGKPLTFQLFIISNDLARKVAQIIQAQLRAYGIQVDIQAFEFGTLLAKLRAGEHQAETLGYTYTSPDIFFLWFHSSNVGTGLTFSHNKDPQLDKMIVASRTETARRSGWRSIGTCKSTSWTRRCGYRCTSIPTTSSIQPNVQGTKVHPDGYLVVADMYVR